MSRMPRLAAIEDEQKAANRQTESLAGLALTIALIIASLFLIKNLQKSTALEDCLMAGRLSCGMPAFSQGAATRRI